MQDRGKKIFLGIMAVFGAAVITGCGTRAVQDSDTVMEIAGQSVVKSEYQMILNNYKSQVQRAYTTEEANQKDFWTTEYGNETPLEQIMELAKTDLVRKKVISQLAKDVGIETETEYDAILKQMENETSVYGLTSYEPKDYYAYVYTGVESDLMESLKKEQDISEGDLKQVYQENKEQYTSDVNVQMLVAEMRSESGIELAQQAAETMQQETDIDQLSEQYQDINFYELNMSTLNTQEGKSGAYTQRWLTASVMQQGEISAPFQIGDHLLVMRCLGRSEQYVEPFEEIKGVLKDQVQTQQAEKVIEQKIKEAQISFQNELLEQIALETLQ